MGGVVDARAAEKQKKSLLTLSRQIIARFELNTRLRNTEREARVRQRVESALTVERNFVSTVLDTMGALVAVFDTAGRIVRFNRACEQVSGYDFDSLTGHYLWENLIPQEDVPATIENFERLRGGVHRRTHDPITANPLVARNSRAAAVIEA